MRKLSKLLLVSAAVLSLAACASRMGSPADITDANQLLDNQAKAKGVDSDFYLLDSDVGPHDGLLATRSYYFAFNSNEVNAQDLPAIKAHAQYLLDHKSAKILLEGNADVRGSREYNMALGQRRADAVANIIRMAGVPTSQVKTVSFGSEKPIALGETEADYQKNRRVDLLYTAK